MSEEPKFNFTWLYSGNYYAARTHLENDKTQKKSIAEGWKARSNDFKADIPNVEKDISTKSLTDLASNSEHEGDGFDYLSKQVVYQIEDLNKKIKSNEEAYESMKPEQRLDSALKAADDYVKNIAEKRMDKSVAKRFQDEYKKLLETEEGKELVAAIGNVKNTAEDYVGYVSKLFQLINTTAMKKLGYNPEDPQSAQHYRTLVSGPVAGNLPTTRQLSGAQEA